MKRTITRAILAVMAFVALMPSNTLFQATAQAQAGFVVRTVPWMGLPNKPHEVFSGGSLILQGMATTGLNDTAINGTITSAIWDPGDGSANIDVTAAANSNSLAIEATKSYTGVDGQPYTATLTVKNNLGQTASDTFKIVVKTKTIDVEANMAIDKGLWYLYKQITRGTNGTVPIGYVEGTGSNIPSRVSSTSAALQAMQINNHLSTSNAAEVPYTHFVSRLLRYLESQVLVQVLNNQTTTGRNDNPDTNGNSRGLYVRENTDHRDVYILGQVMDAFISSGTPDQLAVLGPEVAAPNVQNGVKGRKYKDIVQDMLDWYAWAQMDLNASQRGSWYYTASNNTSTGHADNSTSQWAAIGGLAAERVWGLTTPAFVKSEAKLAMAYTHQTANTNSGSPALNMRGSFGYGHSGGNYLWSEGHSSSPSGMVQEIWIGAKNDPTSSDPDDVRFVEGLKWMARHHRIRNNYAGSDPNFGGVNLYALYATTKAYRLALNASGTPTPITLVDDNPADSVPAWDWYYNDPAAGSPAAAGPRGVARSLLGIAQPNGSFVPGGSGYWSGNLGTAWSVIMLSPSLFQLGPTAVCTANPGQVGSFGGTVNFNGAGSFHNDDNGVITSYAWTFGDGGTATTQNASHTYAGGAPATFNATLTVSDSNGLTSTTTCTVQRVNTNVAPDANAGGPYNFCPGASLILDGSASTDEEDGNNLTYAWDLTEPVNFAAIDATTAAVDATALFAARAPGVYNIGLRVTDSLGVTNAEFATVTVRAANDPSCNQPPDAVNDSATTFSGTPVTVAVLANDTDPDVPANTLTVTAITQGANGSVSTNGTTATYSPVLGFFGSDTFTYTISDGKGGTDTATVTVSVNRRLATVTAGSGTKVYGGADPTLTPTSVGFLVTDTMTLTQTRVPGEDVGHYATTATANGANLANYDVTYVAGNLEITPADTVTVVTCVSPQVYTGSAIEVCTANVTGAGGLNQPVSPVSYTDNVNVGTAGASATYGGDANHHGSTGTSAFEIVAAPTATAVSAPTITYAANGVVTVTVTSGSGTVPGIVSLTVDGGAPMTAALTGGSATFTLPSPNAGDHALVATYAAQGNFQGSSATGNLHVNPSPTATTLTSSPSPAAAGQTVTLTATVASVAPGSGVPTGSVTFYDGATAIGTAAVNGSGVAVLTTTTLANGPHTLSAQFAGNNGNYLPSSANTVSQLIYGYPTGGGTFVIGDNNDNLGATVTFWGAQWANQNSMTGGAANNSFKGLASAPSPPVVGGVFTGHPGNSGPAPAAVPQYIGVIVTSKVTKSGSNISGTIVGLVVVKVNPGYQASPGYPGTGTVVAIVP